MLVLTRKVGEQINIGDEIVVRVIEVNRGNVKIGIDAPASVSIYRQEVYEKIQEQVDIFVCTFVHCIVFLFESTLLPCHSNAS